MIERNKKGKIIKVDGKPILKGFDKWKSGDMKKNMFRWMLDNWGERCPDYCKGCALCKAWKCFDYLFEWDEDGEREQVKKL